MTILRAGGLGGGGLAVSRLQSGQIVSSGPVTILSPNVSYFLPDDLPVQIPGAESGVADYTSGDLTAASALPSGLSLAQAGTTRYFNSSGVLSAASANTARFGNEYNGTSWVQRGLTLEPARTNILLQSNTFNNVAWSTFGGTLTSGATTSPDGTANAWKLAEDTSATANHDVFQGVVAGTAGIWTMSVYLKAAGRNWVCLNNTKGGGTAHVYVDLSTGSIGTNTGFDNVVVTNVGNGWYRCETTVSGMLATDTIYLAIYMATSDLSVNAPTYTGVAGGAGIYLAFGQTELGTGVSSYISTTTAATTRAADALTATAGGALDTILSASGASIVVGSFLRNLGTNGRLVGNSSGTQSPAYVASNTTAGIQGTSGTSSTATVGSSGVYIGSAELTGAAWDWTSGSLVANEGTVVNLNMGPQLGSGAYFFRDSAGTAAVIGYLQSVKAWFGRLSDTDLQTATNPSVNAVVAQTLGALVTAATDTVLAQATIAQTLGALGEANTEAVLDQAVVAQTLSALAQAATASAPAGAVTAQILGALGQTTTATAPVAITVAQNLGALTQATAGTVSVSAAAAQTLGAIVQAATGGVIDQATAAQTLGGLAQAAAATITAAGTVYWNPSDKDSNITLSNSNLTATLSGAVTLRTVRANVSNTSGYFEYTVGVLLNPNGFDSGVGLSNTSVPVSTWIGDDTNAVGYYPDTGGSVYYNSAIASGGSSLGTFGAGDVIGVELTAAPSIKFYKNGTLVYTYTGTMPSGDLYPSLTLGTQTDSGTANFGATSLAYLPAGAQSWDGTQGTGAVNAVVAQTLGDLSQAAIAAAPLAAAASQTLGALAQSASGTISDAGVIAQTLGALVQSTGATVTDSAAVAQTLGALVQAATATAPVPGALQATQTLGDLGQALTGTVLDAATVVQNLGALGQSAAAAGTDSASVAQTLGAIVQATSGAVIDAAAVSQALGALNQTAAAVGTSGFFAAQTLGGIVQALTGTAIDAATVAQALGGLGQTAAGGVVATIPARTDSLPALGQAATGVHVSFANVAQVLGALSQIATAQGPGEADFLAGQILGALQQVAASNVPQRVQAAQALGALGQAVALRITPVAGVAIRGSAVKLKRGFGSLGQRASLAGSLNQKPILTGNSRGRIILSGSTR